MKGIFIQFLDHDESVFSALLSLGDSREGYGSLHGSEISVGQM